MPRYRNTSTGRIVERPESYVAAYPEGLYVPVNTDSPLWEEPCCGANDPEEDEDD